MGIRTGGSNRWRSKEWGEGFLIPDCGREREDCQRRYSSVCAEILSHMGDYVLIIAIQPPFDQEFCRKDLSVGDQLPGRGHLRGMVSPTTNREQAAKNIDALRGCTVWM